MPSEPEGVGKRDPDVGMARLCGNVVEIALRVFRMQVDRRRDHLVADGQGADHRFHCARRPHHVAGHRLGAADRQPLGVLAEYAVNGVGLEFIVQRRAGTVGVDVVDALRLDPGFA